MGTVYILGAGFSKTCGIATDLEMLDALNLSLPVERGRLGGHETTTIDYLREQVFQNAQAVGFELFMSTLSAMKFSAEYLALDRNVFQEGEDELRNALRKYLKSSVRDVNWEKEGQLILKFLGRVDWRHDFILTFNYDLLVETAAKKLNLTVGERIIHLHGAIGESALAWPTYVKFGHKATKKRLAPRWKDAFNILRDQTELEKLVFIGYSMPPSDLEAKALFNYTDLYNSMSGSAFCEGRQVLAKKQYSYQIVVVNPSKSVKPNYGFFRKAPVFLQLTLEKWLKRQP